jgi:hypothetical protein
MRLDERFPLTLPFQPHRDEDRGVVESASDYVLRMRRGPLAHWPVEVLVEWLHRHADFTEDYAFLGFEHFRFERVAWDLARIPGREAFRDEGFCDDFQNVEERAADNSHDWLAHYMLKEGTWNTPIVLLGSASASPVFESEQLKTPYHLLEGHRRLSFLQGLKRLKKALPEHFLWIVHIA